MCNIRLLYCQYAKLQHSRLLRFFLVGMLNTVVGYSIFLTALWVGFHYSVAIMVATVLGTLFNFKSTGVMVFKSHDHSRLWRFVMIYILLYAVNVTGMTILIKFGLPTWFSAMLLLLPLAFLSYFLNSRYVFLS